MYLAVDKINQLVLCFGAIIEYLEYYNVLFVNERQIFSLNNIYLYEDIIVPEYVEPFKYKFDGENFIPIEENDSKN